MRAKNFLLTALGCTTILATLANPAISTAATAAPASATPDGSTDWGTPKPCTLDADTPTAVDGTFTTEEARTYRMVPFTVPEGTTRIEVGYSWDDLPPAPENSIDRSTVDLGLWDNDGYDTYDGFRGWSGSRQGKIAKDMAPIWVQAGSAERGYLPGKIEPGTWWVELGAGGIAPNGASYHVEIACYSPALRPDAPASQKTPKPDPVDPAYIANSKPGWYYGDFHLHAYHSNSKGLAGPEMVTAAKAGGLDIIPVTEYVTNRHWDELGAAQRANPDVLLWPSREIITYYGHVITFGETRNTIEYRQGFEGVNLGDIQKSAKEDGALFGVAHPTVPGGALARFCRGCAFELGESIDWSLVDTLEIHNGNVPDSPLTQLAIDLWDQHLREGHKITAVSGTDDKSGDQYGFTATAVYAKNLSRTAVADALQDGHAYVMILGREQSPHLEMTATSPDGKSGIFGDTLVADTATAEVTITGGQGQTLEIVSNGTITGTQPITADPFTTTIDLSRDKTNEGPLGSYWRIQTRNAAQLTTVGNPIFLADQLPPSRAATGSRKDSDKEGTNTSATSEKGVDTDQAKNDSSAKDDSTAKKDASTSAVLVAVLIGGTAVVLAAIGLTMRKKRRAQ